jgi:MarR family transcriptional regulator, organic hydroperoxide resistance regulator
MSDKTPAISNIIDNLRRVFQILNEQSKKVEKDTGLTGPQLWAIKAIHENAPINLSDLAGRLYLHPTTVVGIIDRLEMNSYVKRTRSKGDRRMVQIELTAKGKSLLNLAPEVAQGLLVAGLEELPATRLVEIDRSMRRLVKIFGAQKIPPKLILSSEVNLSKRK